MKTKRLIRPALTSQRCDGLKSLAAFVDKHAHEFLESGGGEDADRFIASEALEQIPFIDALVAWAAAKRIERKNR